MHAFTDRLPAGSLVSEEDLAREFDTRLAESSRLAFRVAYSVLRQRQDAEDVAQEAFVRAFRRFAGLRDRERFRAWIVRVTWRLALDWRRGEKRRGVREQAVAELHPMFGDADADVLAGERASRLWRAIDELPDRLRLTLVLSSIEGHHVREVARLLHIPEGTVKSRLFEARKQLEERLR